MSMSSLWIAALTAASLPALGAPRAHRDPGERDPSTRAPGWHARQATGQPDTPEAGDHQTAWTSATPDGGREWLTLTFARAVAVDRVRIVESYNPGAVTGVVGLHQGGEVELWRGLDPTRRAPKALVVRADRPIVTDRIRVELDTSRVAGWNEIDAVALIGADGSTQWAIDAEASSSYGQPPPPPADPLAALIGHRVTAHVAGQVVEGTLQAIDADEIHIRGALRDHVVSRRWLQLLSWDRSFE